MKEIGGFFELELQNRKEFHNKGIKLNTARNALEYILRAGKYQKIYLPYYICESILEPINKLGINVEYYSIDSDFNVQFDFNQINDQEILLFVNYFGMFDDKVKNIVDMKKRIGFNLCIDNTQSFFSTPFENVDTIYSVRKFFGVPDGAYLYTKQILNQNFEIQTSFDHIHHLVKRIELGSQRSYLDFKEHEDGISNQPIRKMSRLSGKLLSSIDYNIVLEKRLTNFNYIQSRLEKFNKFKVTNNKYKCPMVYPFLHDKGIGLRKFFIQNGVYVAQYWPEVLKLVKSGCIEYELAKNMVPIPIDQRYDEEDMNYILNVFDQYMSSIV